MKLSRLKLRNYRRLQDSEIEIREHLVLVGANDVGKSSLLRVVNLTLGASIAQLYAQLSSDDLRDQSEPLLFEVDLVDFDPGVRAHFPDEIDALTDTLTIQLRVELDDQGTVRIDRTAPNGATGRQLSRNQIDALGWRFLSTTSVSRDLREGKRGPVDELLSGLELGDERSAFEKLADDFQKHLNGSNALGTLRQSLANQLSKALPKSISSDDLVFVSGSGVDTNLLNDVHLQIIKDEVPHGLSQQSDGTRALYAIALYDFLSVEAHIVAIDEPEIHLHPTSQRSMAKLLCESSSQKVIATHSPDIVSAFDISDVVVVRPGGQLVQSKRDLLEDDERTLVKWWVRDKLEPLTAACIVTVEGLSDRIVLERVAELTGRNLDRLGVSVLETDGNSEIKAIAKLFGPDGFGIPMLRLIDLDAVGKVSEILGYKIDEFAENSIFVSSKDLEDEYVSALGPENVRKILENSGLFTKNELSNLSATDSDGALTGSDVASFCRKGKYKIRSAIAIAPALSRSTAVQISSIESLLKEFDS